MNYLEMLKEKKTTKADNEFGMTFIESKKVPVESLKFNQDYQRIKQPARVKRVAQGMIACGQFLNDKPLTVNQNNEVVDGQHRLWAAIEVGYTHVPIIRYNFATPELEAKYFIFTNNYDPRLKAPDFWYASLLSKDPLATFLYRLDDDEISKLKNNIALKGKDTSYKWTIIQALDVVGFILGYPGQHWQKNLHDKWVASLKNKGQKQTILDINDFVVWHETIFGVKKKNPYIYHKESLRAIRFFYHKLKEKGWHNKSTTINKMKLFQVDSAFVTAPLAGKKQLLVSHFNHKKKKDVLDYSII